MGGKGLGGRKVSEKKAETLPKGQVRFHHLALRSRRQTRDLPDPNPNPSPQQTLTLTLALALALALTRFSHSTS